MYSSKPDDGNLPEVVPFSAPEVAVSNAPEVATSNAPETLSPEDAKHARNLEEPQAKYPVVADPTPLCYPVEKSDLAAGPVVSPLSPDGANAISGLDAALAGDGTSTVPSPPTSPTTSPTLGRNEDAEAQDGQGDEKKEKERTYCGLSKRNLIIIIVVAIVAVAALAGGLGGGLANKRTTTTGNANGGNPEAANGSGSASTTAPTATESTSASSTSSSSISTFSASSTTPVPSPTATTIIGDEDFSFDGWAANNYKGSETPTYKDTGFIDLPFNVSSYVWNRGGTLCCLTFCQGNSTSTGYWCDTRERPAALEYFDRIYIWCDQNAKDRGSMCSP